MKFREIFCFEFLYQARRVHTWFYFAVLFVVAYLLKRQIRLSMVASIPTSMSEEEGPERAFLPADHL